MLREDLETSLAKHLRDELGEDVLLDEAGDSFRASGVDAWVRPRIVSIVPTGSSRKGEEDDLLELQVVCYIPTDQKGGRAGDLSRLVDQVRAVVDSTLAAPAARVRDADGLVVGTIQFGPAAESRAFGQAVDVRGDSIPGVDSATLSVECRVRGGTCG